MSIQRWLQVAVFAGFALVSSPHAALARDVVVPAVGESFIGRIDWFWDSGHWMCTIPSDGSANRWVYLGPLAGLQENIRIVGTGSRDKISFVRSGGNLCGYTWDTIVYNGYTLDVLGQGGNDVLNGNGPSYLFGGTGNNIITGGSNTVISGEAGNDHLLHNGYNTYGIGGLNDDCFYGIGSTVGATASQALAMIGNDGYDASCGLTGTVPNLWSVDARDVASSCTTCVNRFNMTVSSP